MPDAETTSSSNNSETPMKKCELNPSLAGNVLQQVSIMHGMVEIRWLTATRLSLL